MNLDAKSKSEYFEQNLKPMSSKQFNMEIDQALDDEKNIQELALLKSY